MAGLVFDTMPSSASTAKRDKRRMQSDSRYMGAVSLASLCVIAGTMLLIATIAYKGIGSIDWQFLSESPSDGMSAGGIWPMIRGSLLLIAGTLLLTLPLGVLAGVFMAEYAGKSRWVHLVQSLVTSLAGTPSIVYGLFGFAVFVLMFKFGVSLLAGWLTLSVMSLPIVVLTTEEAIREVPDSLIDGGLALGMSRWQVVKRVMLPNALPGILTGLVLAVSRAAGEAPPILLTAGIYYSTVTPQLSFDTVKQPVANLPYHLAEAYRQSAVIPEHIVWGTCFVLMAFILVVNLTSIVVRYQIRKRKVT